jgi:hypothetical protein
MRIGTRFALLVAVSAFASGLALAQSADISVGEIGFPKRVWGTQTMSFDVINKSEIPKFLVVETEVSFEDSYAPARRQTLRNYILAPKATMVCDPLIEIPGNYGKGIVRIVIHDVVDTLDDVSLGQKVFEQPFHLMFNPPESVLPYRQDKISLPPLVDKSPLMDSEFSRLLLVMLQEGKTPAEIAGITGADSVYVVNQIKLLADNQYLVAKDGQYVPAIPVLLRPEADEARELANRISDALVQQIKTNWPEYDTTAASLVNRETKLGGNQGFMGGVVVLRQPYVVVTGMLLWSRLGSRFIIGTGPLEIFKQTNPCQAYIAQYSYLVQGGDYYNGHQYFDGQYSASSETLLFGDTVPVFTCVPGWERLPRLSRDRDYKLLPVYNPETFYYDTAFSNPALAVLDKGMEDILTTAATAMQEIHTKYGHSAFTAGVRYWFWNLTATLVTDKLLKDGLIQRTGNGQYRYMRKK